MKKLNSTPHLLRISLRLPLWVLTYIKERAAKENVPYQSLIKIFLAERVKEELTGKRGRATL